MTGSPLRFLVFLRKYGSHKYRKQKRSFQLHLHQAQALNNPASQVLQFLHHLEHFPPLI